MEVADLGTVKEKNNGGISQELSLIFNSDPNINLLISDL